MASHAAIFAALLERDNARPAAPYGVERATTNDISSITVASALSAGPLLPLSDQPAGYGAIASWSPAALNEHRTRLPPDLTSDSGPAATFRPCLHDPAAPTAQIIQVCGRCLDAIRALLAEQSGGSARDLSAEGFAERGRAPLASSEVARTAPFHGLATAGEFAAAGRGGCDGRPASIA